MRWDKYRGLGKGVRLLGNILTEAFFGDGGGYVAEIGVDSAESGAGVGCHVVVVDCCFVGVGAGGFGIGLICWVVWGRLGRMSWYGIG